MIIRFRHVAAMALAVLGTSFAAETAPSSVPSAARLPRLTLPFDDASVRKARAPGMLLAPQDAAMASPDIFFVLQGKTLSAFTAAAQTPRLTVELPDADKSWQHLGVLGDMAVFCSGKHCVGVGLKTKALSWHVKLAQADDAADSSPRHGWLMPGAVVCLRGGRLAAFAPDTGKPLWKSDALLPDLLLHSLTGNGREIVVQVGGQGNTLWVVSLATGAEIARFDYEQSLIHWSGLSPSGTLYVATEGLLTAYDLRLGKEDCQRWQRAVPPLGVGARSSTVAGDALLVYEPKRRIICLSEKDGKERWTSALPAGAGRGEGLRLMAEGHDVLCVGEHLLDCHNLADGERQWAAAGLDLAPAVTEVRPADPYIVVLAQGYSRRDGKQTTLFLYRRKTGKLEHRQPFVNAAGDAPKVAPIQAIDGGIAMGIGGKVYVFRCAEERRP